MPCPAGSQYLTVAPRPTFIFKVKSFLARLPLLNRLLTRDAEALAGNFCLVDGAVSGYNSAGNRGVLEFKPQKALEANRQYYVIIKGDSNLSDAVKEGVLSADGISLRPTDSQTFNGLNFQGKIWWFKTMPDNRANNGICQFVKAEIEPASHLFQTNKNNSGDDDPAAVDKSFDKLADSDKMFIAKALAADGTVILPVSGIYEWTWVWSSGANAFGFVPANGLPNNIPKNLDNHKRVVQASANYTDGEADIIATATIRLGPLTPIVQTHAATAKAYLMVCDNPWPAVNAADGSWAPWSDSENCTVPGDCASTNFKVAYCRDAGGPGTADDLPAVLNQAVVRGQNLKCTDPSGSCPAASAAVVGTPCGAAGNTCQIDIVKDIYFFREKLTSVSDSLKVTSLEEGGGVTANWSPVSSPEGEEIGGYKLYYGTAKGKYTNSIDVKNFVTAEVKGLTNNKTYYFAVTSYTKKGAESKYSNEEEVEEVKVLDTKAPDAPKNLEVGSSAISTIILSWRANHGDTVNYKVYYGSVSGSLGGIVNISKTKCSSTVCTAMVSGLNPEANYYFAVSALDASGNESAKSEEKAFIITAAADGTRSFVTDYTRCRADLIKILSAIGIKRDQSHGYLVKVTGNNCSACPCWIEGGGRSAACYDSLAGAYQKLGFPGLLFDPWSDPYQLNENEYEFAENKCMADGLASFRCGSINVPLYMDDCQ